MKNVKKREELLTLDKDTKYSFTGVFKRKGCDKRFRDRKTVLITDIKIILEGEEIFLTDHVWVPLSKRWKSVEKDLKEGDILTFDAEVKEYYKEGEKDFFVNYGLGSLRNVKREK